MTSYVLSVNEKMGAGKYLIAYLKSLSKESNYLNIMPQRTDKHIEKVILSDEEMKQVEKSLNSGFSTMDELQEILRK
jgi:hypothetical protein